MKAKLVLFLFFFLLVGCTPKEKETKIETIIEENKHYKIGINYPVTQYKKIDDAIIGYINTCYQDFLNEQEKMISLDTFEELNIDYTLYQNKEYISITL